MGREGEERWHILSPSQVIWSEFGGIEGGWEDEAEEDPGGWGGAAMRKGDRGKGRDCLRREERRE